MFRGGTRNNPRKTYLTNWTTDDLKRKRRIIIAMKSIVPNSKACITAAVPKLRDEAPWK